MICHDLKTALRDPDRVRELNLSRMGMSTLPQEVRQLRHLRVLDIRWNKLSTLPDWIGELSELEVLYAQHNQLTAWPAAGAQLSRLRRLELGDNQLKKMPAAALPARLERLGLAENRIRTLHWDRPFPQLKRLELRKNRLIRWPEIPPPVALAYLDLQDNKLQVLPDTLDLPKLVDLDLSRNRLEAVAPLGQLHQLQQLDLSRNRLGQLSPEVGKLTFLRKLILDRNQLSVLPSNLSSLTWLREISLARNQFKRIPPVLSRIPRLEILNLARNQIKEDLSLGGYPRLRWLNLAHNQIDRVIALPAGLWELNLRYNPLIRLHGLDACPELSRLDATQTGLSDWPFEVFSREKPIYLSGVYPARVNAMLRTVLRKMPVAKWTPVQREMVFDMLRGEQPDGLKLWGRHDLARLLQINARKLRDNVRAILLAHPREPLTKAGAFAIYGKLQTPRQELSARLASSNLKLDPHAKAIILGRPPYPPLRRSYDFCSFFSEAAVLDHLRSLESPVGPDLSRVQEEKLVKLLLHPFAAQVKLGLNLLASQRLSPRLQAALILSFKLQKDPVLKKKERELIDRRCAPELWPLVSRPLSLWRGQSPVEKRDAIRHWLRWEKGDFSLFLDLVSLL